MLFRRFRSSHLLNTSMITLIPTPFFLYLTVNKFNGKFYIGRHADDGRKYIGSGSSLKRAVKKYGRGAFHTEIIVYCDTLVELIDLEKLVVDSKLVSRADCYNRALGGSGGCQHSDATKSKIAEASRSFWAKLSPEHRSAIGHKMSQSLNGRKGTTGPVKRWARLTAEERANENKRYSDILRNFWDNAPAAVRSEIASKRYAGMSEDEKKSRASKISNTWKKKSKEEIAAKTAKRAKTMASKTDAEKALLLGKLSEANRRAQLARSPKYIFENVATGQLFEGNRHDFIKLSGLTETQVNNIIYRQCKRVPRNGWKVKEKCK